MAKEEISITRALKEVKLLDARINKAAQELVPVDLKQKKLGDVTVKSKQTIADFSRDAKSKYESFWGLIDRKNKIKAAISAVNSKAKVKIGKERLTIAEAIERKRNIQALELFLNNMKRHKMAIDRDVENNRASIDSQIETFMAQSVGKDRRNDKEDYDKISKPILDANLFKVVDPLNVQQKIKELETQIENFTSEIDIVLSEVNSKTNITI